MKGKDLKPGMMTDRGLILEIDLDGSNSKFWSVPNFMFIDANDAYMGPCVGRLDLDTDYAIICETGTEEYRKLIEKMVETLVESSKDRANDAREIAKFLKL